jgi:hypothetical protein
MSGGRVVAKLRKKMARKMDGEATTTHTLEDRSLVVVDDVDGVLGVVLDDVLVVGRDLMRSKARSSNHQI